MLLLDVKLVLLLQPSLLVFVESSSSSGGTNRPPRGLSTKTYLEGGGSGGGRGAVHPRASLYVKCVGYSEGCVPPACVDSQEV